MGVRLSSRSFRSKNTRTKFQGKDIMLLCPLTFMNRSGESVRACAAFHNLETSEILVVHDDLDLPLGRLKVVKSGGPGGHKGVISIVEALGSTEFSRIKVGIGRPRYGEEIEDFVLSPFYGDEQSTVQEVLGAAVQACELFIMEGVESAMNQMNCLNFSYKEVQS